MTEQQHVQTENTAEPEPQKVKKRGTLSKLKEKIKSKFGRKKKDKVAKNEGHDQEHDLSSDESDDSGRGRTSSYPNDTQGTTQGTTQGLDAYQSPIRERDFITSHPELISDKSQFRETSVPEKEVTSRTSAPEKDVAPIGLSDIATTAPVVIRRRPICNERQLQSAIPRLRHIENPISGLHESVKLEYLQEKKAALSAALKEDMARIHLSHVANAPDGSVSDKVKAAYVEEQLVAAIKDDTTRMSLTHVDNAPDGSVSDRVKAAYVEEQLAAAIKDDSIKTSLAHVSNPPNGSASEEVKAAYLEEQKAKGNFSAPSGLREGVEAAYLGAYLEAQDVKPKNQIIEPQGTGPVTKNIDGLRPGVEAAYLGAYLEAQNEKVGGTGENVKDGIASSGIASSGVKHVSEDGLRPGVKAAYLGAYIEAQNEMSAVKVPEEKGFGQKIIESLQHAAVGLHSVALSAAEGIESVALTAAGMLHAPQNESSAPVAESRVSDTTI